MTSLLLAGFYGMSNTGDDVLLALTAERARAGFSTGIRVLASGSPILPVAVVTVLPPGTLRRGEGRARAARAALQTRSVLFSGGSVFSSSSALKRDLARLAAVGLVKVAAANVSIGPFASRGDAEAVGSILRRFSAVSVRDRGSFARAQELGVDAVQGFDTAALVARSAWCAPGEIRPDGDAFEIGISACPSAPGPLGAVDLARAELIAGAVAVAYEHRRISVRLLEFSRQPDRPDRPMLELIAERLPPTASIRWQDYSADPRLMLGAIRRCAAVVAMRLHGAVLAYAVNTPFRVVAYHEKCVEFCESVGLPDCVVDARSADAAGELGAWLLSPGIPASALATDHAAAMADFGLDYALRGCTAS